MGLYTAVGAVLLVAGNLAFRLQSWVGPAGGQVGAPSRAIIGPLVRWDSGWYLHIAQHGYFYDGPGHQAAVAFFPGYPAAVRLVAFVVRDAVIAGILVTLASGAAASALFFRWCLEKFDRRTAWTAVALLLLYPFSYFLYGTVYSDALFVVCALGAFMLLERDQPILAGIVGAVAVAGRPVGIAVALGLAAVAVQRRGSLRALRWRDGGVLIAGLGFVAYLAYLQWRFGDAFAFTKVQTAPGWNRQINIDMIMKVDFYRRWRDFGITLVNVVLTLQAVLSVVALCLVPRVWRRVGWGYAVYVLAVLGIPLASSSDFLAMGRYLLPAFPVFAVAGEALSRRTRSMLGVLTVNGVLLIWLTTLFARSYLLS